MMMKSKQLRKLLYYGQSSQRIKRKIRRTLFKRSKEFLLFKKQTKYNIFYGKNKPSNPITSGIIEGILEAHADITEMEII